MKRGREIFECPNCGADVPVGSKACRECGSDAATGWQSAEEVEYQGLELPEGYALDKDHPGGVVQRQRPRWLLPVAVVAALALLLWTLLR
jgi:hypothetical protein